MTTALATSSTLAAQITVVTDRLAPVGDDAIAKALRSLQTAGLGLPASVNPKDMNKVYSYALQGLSHEALMVAVRKLVRGEYDIDRKAFIPTPPELAAMVRSEARVITDDLVRLKQKAEAIRLQSKPSTTEGTARDPKARERVQALLGQFRASVAASKAQERGAVADDSVSPEMADMWAKIMDLPDAKEVGIEQVQYRNAVRAKLAKASQPDEDSTNREAGHFGSRSNDWRGHRLVIDEMNRRAEETR